MVEYEYVETCKKACQELIDIVNKNFYRHNQKYKEELLTALKQKTGSENVSIFISYIIDHITEKSQI